MLIYLDSGTAAHKNHTHTHQKEGSIKQMKIKTAYGLVASQRLETNGGEPTPPAAQTLTRRCEPWAKLPGLPGKNIKQKQK